MLDVDTGGRLDQFQPFRRELEYASFSYVENRLPVLRSQPTRKRCLINLFDKFGRFSFAKYFELTINNGGLQTTAREGSRENQLTRVLGYVYEAAGTCQAAVEQADVDIAVAIDLGHAESPPPS